MLLLFFILGVVIPGIFIFTPGLWPALMIGNLTGIIPAIVDMINQFTSTIFGG